MNPEDRDPRVGTGISPNLAFMDKAESLREAVIVSLPYAHPSCSELLLLGFTS